jgi:Ca2+/Na+ antiporter
MTSIYRDLGFFCVSLILYDLILLKGIIYLWEAYTLLGLTILYILAVCWTNRKNTGERDGQ